MSVAAPPQPPARRRVQIPLVRRLKTVRDHERAHVTTHLEELRWRVSIVFAWLVVAFAVAWVYRDGVFSLLKRPLHGEYTLQTLSVTEPFFTSVTACAHAAALVTLPVAIYNLYRFASPALEPAQRRSIAPLVALAPLLFVTGVVFCYFLVMGPAVRFLLGIGEGSFEVSLRAQEYYSFVGMTLLGMGLAFCFPLVLVGAGRLGLLRAETLRGNRRIAFVLIAIAAALLPTADPVSLAVEIIPLVLLFELSIWLVALQERRAARRVS